MATKGSGREAKLIIWFDELRKEDTLLVGGKCANLGELISAGIPVPPGFAVTAYAYEKFITETGIASKIYDVIGETVEEEGKPEQFERASIEIRRIIESTPVPKDVREAIGKAYRRLCKELGHVVSVAVRSSATAEDMPDASFAGQQETFLNVSGEDELVEKTRRCWSSLFTPRAIFYRIQKGYPHEKVLISVGVQKMVNAKAAGVIFTINPVTGEPNQIIIEANWGLGESVVSGAVTPDNYIVDKNTLKIVEKRIAKKTVEYVRDPETGKTVHVEVPAERQEQPCLTDREVIRLAELAKRIEEHYGKPQDIEWAIDRDLPFPESVFIVQSRPETVWSLRVAPPTKPEAEAPTAPFRRVVVTKGQPASPGIYAGVAKVALTTEEAAALIEKGDILTTKMTAPDWVPYMRVAGAIITDDGGMTCFSGDTKLLTDRGFMGFKEVYEAISRGEQLSVLSFGLREMKTEWKKITAAMRRRASLIRVAISQTGRARKNTLDLTPDHKLLSVNGRRLVYEGVTDILNDGKMVCVAHKIPSLTAQLDPSVDEAYVLGAIISDGNIELTRAHGQTYFLQKPLPEKIPFIDSVRRAFRRAYGYELREYPKGPSGGFIRGEPVRGAATSYYCARKGVAKRLQGLKENLQEWVLDADEETLTSFLASLADGGGSMPKESSRLHLFIGEEALQATVIALLRLGILPQVTASRGIYNVQVVEKADKILSKTKRLKPGRAKRVLGSRFYSARQLLQDIIEQADYKGRVRPYVNKNLLIGADKIQKYILPAADENTKRELQRILGSDFRMQRIVKIGDLGENDVYNIEVEDNHNYIVFTKHYTPLIVRNCHAAIVSRELGIPCIVGAGNATKVIKTGRDYTVDAKAGVVYEGVVEEIVRPAPQVVTAAVSAYAPVTATKIYVNLSIPEVAEKVFNESRPDGVGLLRAEHLMLSV
ncbi:TPA: phosphoenolpyruvate synthase, partial [Candidatus Bathyarchaeota archaeon]|nr:phosphoenolpyruvate synthase [Candidatus Bathyarchaeota archaeon]